MPKAKIAPEDEHEHADGCLCDVDLDDHEMTQDADLPAAKGGVEKSKRRLASKKGKNEESDDIDGCELNFNEDPATEDKDLPAAVGGVA